MSDGKLTNLAPSPSLQRRDSFGRLRLIAWNSELSAKLAARAGWLQLMVRNAHCEQLARLHA